MKTPNIDGDAMTHMVLLVASGRCPICKRYGSECDLWERLRGRAFGSDEAKVIVVGKYHALQCRAEDCTGWDAGGAFGMCATCETKRKAGRITNDGRMAKNART